MNRNTDLEPELERLQAWMQIAVTEAPGVDGLASVERVVEPSRTLSSSERLAIYSRGYRARLLECFRAEFPCLLHACGDELFRHFVEDYLERYPPSNYTLNLLAENFPRHLAETRPDADTAPEDRESWPDFLVDLATLERTFAEVYDGPGLEDETLPDSAKVVEMSTERLAESRFNTAPCLRLLALRYPVQDYFTEVRRGESPPLPAPASTWLALTRKSYTVRMHSLAQEDFELLRGLEEGLTVSTASGFTMLEARDRLKKWTEQYFFIFRPTDYAQK